MIASISSGLRSTVRCLVRAVVGVCTVVASSGFGMSVSGQDAPFSCLRSAAAVQPPELFAAREQGLVDVRVVVSDRHHARLLLKNTTKRPLTVALPAVFAARPVLAQPGIFGAQNGQSSAQANAPQTVAGPMQFGSNKGGQAANGANVNFFQPGGNMFVIPPESVRTLAMRCFCIEHGKPDPRTAVKYELVPAAEAGVAPMLEALLVRYGRGDLDREAMQAAVWHAANGKSWRELASMSRRIAVNADEPLFSAVELRAAKRWVDEASAAIAVRQASQAAGGAAPYVAEGQTLDAGNAVEGRTFTGVQARKASRSR